MKDDDDDDADDCDNDHNADDDSLWRINELMIG